MRLTKAAVISAMMIATAQPTWAQQTAPPPEAAPRPYAPLALAPQPLLNGGTGGYGASPMFSPFPKGGAVLPPSFEVPGLKPASEAPLPFALTLGVDGNEKYSSNVFATSAPAKSDFITATNASVAADADTRKIKGGLKYGLGYDKYARFGEMDGFRQNGIGVFDAEIIDQRLFLGARAAVSEQSINQRGYTGQIGPTTAASRTSAGNVVRIYTESIAPSFQQRFGTIALGQIAYHHDETRYENASKAPAAASSTASTMAAANLNQSTTDGGRIELRSGESFSRLVWDYTGDADHEETKSRTYDQVSHTLGAEYRLTGDFGLLGAVGNDYVHSNAVDLRKYGGGFYTGGFHWTPSPVTDLRVGIGRRYDRTNWIVLGAHWLGPRTVFRFSTDSGVTTDALNFEKALNAIRRDNTGGFVDPFSGFEADPSTSPFSRTSSIYWQRNTDFVLRHDEVRDSFALSARIAEQRILGGAAANLGSTTTSSGSATVVGAYVSWKHNFTPVISGTAMLSQYDTLISDSAQGRTTQRKGSLGFNYNMNPTLLGTLGYSISTTSPTPTGSIREDMIVVGIKKTF